MVDIQKLLENLPYLFLYFIPGYISISIKKSIKHEKSSKDRHIIVMSIVVSFVIRTLLQIIFYIVNWISGKTYEVNKDTNTIILLVMAVVVGLIWVLYCGSKLEKKFNNIFGNNVVSASNVWNHIMKSMKGSWVRVYLKEENIIYIGKLIYYTIDPEENNREILLTSYTSYNFSDRKLLEAWDDDNKMVFIKCDTLKNIEIFKDSVSESTDNINVIKNSVLNLSDKVKNIEETLKDINKNIKEKDIEIKK